MAAAWHSRCTVFLTAVLRRTPAMADQAELDRVLCARELAYPWGAANLATFVAYWLPYFRRLPGGLGGTLAAGHRDPPAELPDPAAPAPRVPPPRTRLSYVLSGYRRDQRHGEGPCSPTFRFPNCAATSPT